MPLGVYIYLKKYWLRQYIPSAKGGCFVAPWCFNIFKKLLDPSIYPFGKGWVFRWPLVFKYIKKLKDPSVYPFGKGWVFRCPLVFKYNKTSAVCEHYFAQAVLRCPAVLRCHMVLIYTSVLPETEVVPFGLTPDSDASWSVYMF